MARRTAAAGRAVPNSQLEAPLSKLLLSSPVGPLFITYTEDGVRAVAYWPQGEHPPAGTRDDPLPGDALGRQIVRELREYFAGRRSAFTLPLAIEGTPFRFRVWEAISRIPPGETRTYGEVARAIDRPGAARAVGQAMRANRLPIVVPCHRVVGARGRLGGYMGGGPASPALELKRWLLRHERGMAGNEERDTPPPPAGEKGGSLRSSLFPLP